MKVDHCICNEVALVKSNFQITDDGEIIPVDEPKPRKRKPAVIDYDPSIVHFRRILGIGFLLGLILVISVVLFTLFTPATDEILPTQIAVQINEFRCVSGELCGGVEFPLVAYDAPLCIDAPVISDVKLAFVYDPPERQQNPDEDFELYVKDGVTNAICRMTDNTDNEIGPIWSPDGTQLAFLSGTHNVKGVFMIDADGQNLRQIEIDTRPREPNFTNIVWSPDGQKLAISDGGNTYIINADGRYQGYFIPSGISGPRRNFAQWSPDSRQIALQSSNYGIQVAMADGSNVRNINEQAQGVGSFAWLPDSQHISYTYKTREPDAEFAYFRISRDDGSDLQEFPIPRTGVGFDFNTLSWSPDGIKLVYNHSSNSTGLFLYSFSLQDMVNKPVFPGGSGTKPVWSTDGTRLVILLGPFLMNVSSHSGLPYEVADFYPLNIQGVRDFDWWAFKVN